MPVSSSIPPQLLAEELECYQGALETLQRAHVPYALTGAFALYKHTGISRYTKDMDIVLEPRWVPPAFAALQELGFVTRIEDPVWLAKAFRGEHFIDLITGIGNAALIVDASWIDRALPDEIFGVPCHVLNVEEMVASKIFVTRRERFDGADVAHLILARGATMDWDRLQQLLGEHWEMLLWSLVLFAYVYPSSIEVVPRRVWGDLTRRFGERIRQPQKNASFRGTLVDPLMFAIDVDEWGQHDLYREYCADHPFPLGVAEPKNRSRE